VPDAGHGINHGDYRPDIRLTPLVALSRVLLGPLPKPDDDEEEETS